MDVDALYIVIVSSVFKITACMKTIKMKGTFVIYQKPLDYTKSNSEQLNFNLNQKKHSNIEKDIIQELLL